MEDKEQGKGEERKMTEKRSEQTDPKDRTKEDVKRVSIRERKKKAITKTQQQNTTAVQEINAEKINDTKQMYIITKMNRQINEKKKKKNRKMNK